MQHVPQWCPTESMYTFLEYETCKAGNTLKTWDILYRSAFFALCIDSLRKAVVLRISKMQNNMVLWVESLKGQCLHWMLCLEC